MPPPPSIQILLGAESELHCFAPYPSISDPKAITEVFLVVFYSSEIGRRKKYKINMGSLENLQNFTPYTKITFK